MKKVEKDIKLILRVLDKAILHGKEHRKAYKGAKACDKSCRNHGDCPWCLENRLYKNKKKMFDFLKDLDY